MRILTGRGRRAPPPTGRVMSTGISLFLIALGAILLFALRTGSGFGLKTRAGKRTCAARPKINPQ